MKNRICKIVALLSLFVLLLSSPTLAMAATLSHQYDEVGYCTSDLPLIKVKKGEKVGVIDAASLKVVLPAEYDSIFFRKGLFEIEKDRKTGYADAEGRIIIPCKYGYREISNYYGEGPILVQENGKLRLVDEKTGKTVATCNTTATYSDFTGFSNGMAVVVENGKRGLIDNTGKLVVPCIYEEIKSFDMHVFKGELTAAKKNGKWGFIDKTGKVIIPFEYDEALNVFLDSNTYWDEKMKVVKNKKWGMVNIKGELEIPCKFDYIDGNFNCGLTPAKIGSKYVYINMQGKIVLAGDYDEARSFKDGVAKVTKGNSTYMINTKGEKVDAFTNPSDFHDGLCIVSKFIKNELKSYYGYANAEKELVIPCEFEDAYSFNDGMALVQKDGKWGYIDTNGNWIIYREFDESFHFYTEGVAEVVQNGKWGLLTKEGDYVFPCEYDSLYCCDAAKRVFTVKNGYMNVWDLEGNKIF